MYLIFEGHGTAGRKQNRIYKKYHSDEEFEKVIISTQNIVVEPKNEANFKLIQEVKICYKKKSILIINTLLGQNENLKHHFPLCFL